MIIRRRNDQSYQGLESIPKNKSRQLAINDSENNSVKKTTEFNSEYVYFNRTSSLDICGVLKVLNRKPYTHHAGKYIC